MTQPDHIRLKRIYEPAAPDDGARFLVERLWPRGVSRERAQLDEWFRDLAPSPDLRRWYDHDLARWDEFQVRYRAELDGAEDELAPLFAALREGCATFLFAARDLEHNSAVVLRAYVLERLVS